MVAGGKGQQVNKTASAPPPSTAHLTFRGIRTPPPTIHFDIPGGLSGLTFRGGLDIL